jgi:signal transduction histidine kinase
VAAGAPRTVTPRVSRRDTLVDVVLAAGAAAAIVAITSQIEPSNGERSVDTLAVATMVTAGGALALRRRLPRAVLAVITGALIVYTARRYAGGPIYLTLGFAFYTLAANAEHRRDALVAAVVSVLAMIVGGIAATGTEQLTWHVAVFPGWAAAAIFLGDAQRNRREYLAGLEERARHLEETRDEEARRRVAEERLRIARDLHDVVAHSIATINLQSGVAAHVLERRPDEAAEALRAIKRTSGEALQELRATLDVLRADTGDDGAPRAPTPGLDRVDSLAASTRMTGLDVLVSRAGDDVTIPAAVDVAGYRIVQESLTNVMRHAGASQATVTITTMPGAVEIEVVDDGRGAATGRAGNADNGGHGIAGMRERAHLAGGELRAGPRPGGGYRVWARLPIDKGQP